MDKLIRKHFENFNVTFGKEDDYLGEMVNDDYITIKNAIIDICKEYHTQQLTIQRVVHSKNETKRVLGDFDVWYKPCTRCGYDTGKSTKPKDGNKTCWKCGNFVQRDYTDRALKK